jgi:hypothetical protein
MILTSPAFPDGGRIPKRYTRDGEELSPPLEVSEVPGGARSLALVADDPDAPLFTPTHWLVWNIPAGTTHIPEGIPAGPDIEALGGARQGRNTFGRHAYMGPAPPFGTHTYRFHLYALDRMLDLSAKSRKRRLLKAMEGHIVETALLTGTYSR